MGVLTPEDPPHEDAVAVCDSHEALRAEVNRLRRGLQCLLDIEGPRDRRPIGILDCDNPRGLRLSKSEIVRNMLAGREWDDDGE